MPTEFPFPPAALNPNARNRWAAIKAKKRYRGECFALARSALARRELSLPPGDDPIELRLDFWLPWSNRIQHDDDNLSAMFKAGRDGLAQALRIDDKRLRQAPPIIRGKHPTKKWGEVVVSLHPLTG